MADRKHGIPAPATTSTVRDEDWPGRDLSGEKYDNVAFFDVDMMELINDGAVFTECAFRGVRFNVSRHTGAAFLNCTFTRCTFFDSTFTGCKLSGSMFDGCTFELLKVDGGDWSFTGLPGADLRGSDLTSLDPLTTQLKGAIIDPYQSVVIVTSLGLEVRDD